MGRVCTDLWWATLIEPEVLIKIVAEKTGEALAKKIVSDYSLT